LLNIATEGFISGGGGRLAFTGVIDDWTAQSGRPVLLSNFVPAVSDSGAKYAEAGRILGLELDLTAVPFLCVC